MVSEFAMQFENVLQIDPEDIHEILKDTYNVDLIYPGGVENNDFISKFRILYNKVIFNIFRDQDLYEWKYAKQGFFRFKENIPKINQFIYQNF